MKKVLQSLLTVFLLITTTTLSHAEVLLQETNGKNTSFSSLKGKWVFINYWAGWCQTCVEEIPEFNRFYQNHKKDPVVLYAVNYDSPPLHEQKNLIQKLNISYPNLLTDPAQALNLEDIRGVPVTFVFNPEGKLVKTLYGGQTAKSLDAIIAAS